MPALCKLLSSIPLFIEALTSRTSVSIRLGEAIWLKSLVPKPGRTLLSVSVSVMSSSLVVVSVSRAYFLRKLVGRLLAGMSLMLMFSWAMRPICL